MAKHLTLPVFVLFCVALSAPNAWAANYRSAFENNAPTSLERMAQAQLKAHPGDAEAQAWLARSLYLQGKFQASKTALKRSSGLAGLLAEGDYDLYVGEYQAAIKVFEVVRAQSPNDVDARLGIASADLDLNQRYDAAYTLAKESEGAARALGSIPYSRCLVMEGGALGLKANKGNLFDKIRFGPRVQKVLLKAVAIAPTFPHAQFALGRFYLEAPGVVGGDPQKAALALSKAVQLDPYYFLADAWYIRALKKTDQNTRATAEISSYQHKFGSLAEARAELASI
jgi:tetratricopeptide (TPR) repeat protein